MLEYDHSFCVLYWRAKNKGFKNLWLMPKGSVVSKNARGLQHVCIRNGRRRSNRQYVTTRACRFVLSSCSSITGMFKCHKYTNCPKRTAKPVARVLIRDVKAWVLIFPPLAVHLFSPFRLLRGIFLWKLVCAWSSQTSVFLLLKNKKVMFTLTFDDSKLGCSAACTWLCVLRRKDRRQIQM